MKNLLFLMLLLLSTFTFTLMSRTRRGLRTNSYDDELIEESENDTTEDRTACLWKTHLCASIGCTTKKYCYV